MEAWELRGVINMKSWKDPRTEQTLCFTLLLFPFLSIILLMDERAGLETSPSLGRSAASVQDFSFRKLQ